MPARTGTGTGTGAGAGTPAGAARTTHAAGYQWVALANTTLAVFMSALDGSIVIIALPAIFRGIHLDPLAAGNVSYLLWMIMGYRLVQAVLVVTLGRLGDMYGRVRIYNAGFAVLAAASVLLSVDPLVGGGALWLIGWRVAQALGGSMLTANSAAIPVFWVNVPVGVAATMWAYRKLREVGARHPGRIDGWGNLTFALGLGALLIAATVGIQPYRGHTIGWESPAVLAELACGVLLLVSFVAIESRVAEPMFEPGLFRIRAFAAGSAAGLIAAAARGGLQFMLIIWLQGIWLPLHGYAYADTPLWAGIYLLPLTAAFLISGPAAGTLSDRFGTRGLATAGMLVFGASFIGLLLPVDFAYVPFALLLVVNGIGVGLFSAPNSSSIMGSVPARRRGMASGMGATFQNSGTALSIGVFFSLLIAGLARSLPVTLTRDLEQQGVPPAIAQHVASLPPVASLFAAMLGVNPVAHLLAASGALAALPRARQQLLTGRVFFPNLIAGPFHQGLSVVFAAAAVLSVLAALASLMRGGRYVPPEAADA